MADSENEKLWTQICSTYDHVCRQVEVANRIRTAGNLQEAQIFYKLANALINMAQPERLSGHDENHQQIVAKLFVKRDEIMQQIAEFSRANRTAGVSHKSTARHIGWSCASKAHHIYTSDNVQVYHIDVAGGVSTSSSSTFVLRILCLLENSETNFESKFFMQIIDQSLATPVTPHKNVTTEAGCHGIYDKPWVYPLISDVSPYRFVDGVLIVPDLYASAIGSMEANATVCIVVSEKEQAVLMDTLEAIMSNDASTTKPERAIEVNNKKKDILMHEYCENTANAELATEPSTTVAMMSKPKVEADEKPILPKRGNNVGKLPRSLDSATIKAQSTSHKPKWFFKSLHLDTPSTSPSDSSTINVPDSVLSGMKMAKSTTDMAASLTDYVADSVFDATMALSNFFAPSIQRGGSQLLSKSMGYSDTEAEKKMSEMFSAVGRFGDACADLEKSAAVLATGLRDSTVQRVEHKYGPSAGELAAATIDTVGNVIKISQNVRMFVPRS